MIGDSGLVPGIGVPLQAEVRDQLERMLQSIRFRNADTQAAFLKLIGERALQGKKKTAGHIIADQLFPGKAALMSA